ncbi:protein BTG3-like isoform X2 [Littorina saxatilis]
MMRDEIDAAVHFFGRVIIASNGAISHLGEFKSCLSKLLEKRFQNHWHVEIPGKGQGYRSIRMHPSEPLDPVLEQAALDSAFNYDNFFIPMEFTLWVDPKDVSCRFGDLKATYCTVLKDKDNKSNSIDVEELLETAKAVYTRQQHISIQHTNKQMVQPSMVMDIYQYERNGQHYPSGSPPLYYDAFHPHHHHPGSNFLLYGAAGDGFSTPPPPFTSPSSPPQFQPSFLSSAVNTTPRKGSGKGGNFRKSGGGGGSGTGRGSRHNHHHQQQHNGEGTTFNHNHNNNHNTNGSTPNGTNWNGDRYHWVKGSKQQQQQQQISGSGKEAK